MSFMSTHHGNRANGSKTSNVQLAVDSSSIICIKKLYIYTYVKEYYSRKIIMLID